MASLPPAEGWTITEICVDQSSVNRTENVQGTLRFLYFPHLLYGIINV